MKLVKDNFKRSDLEASEKRIKQFIMDYVDANKLTAKIWTHNKTSVSIGNSPPPQYQELIPHFKSFILHEFKLFNANNLVSHNISFENNFKAHFFQSAFENLQHFDKVIFIKTILYNSIDRHFYKTIAPQLENNDFWLTYRYIAPFVKTGQSTNDVREALTPLQNKSIDTEEKVLSFAYYLQYYKQICKRTDIKSGILKLLRNKVEEQHYPIFEKILGTTISQEDVKNNNIFMQPNEVKVLLLDKDKTFEQISFANIPQPHVSNYNRYFNLINEFLTSKNHKDLTGINRIDFFELNSSKEPARVYIEAAPTGFKADIEELYLHLIKSCSHLLTQQYTRINPLLEPLETATTYYFLNKTINKDLEEDNLKTKKINKI